jgi:hypothetical protein
MKIHDDSIEIWSDYTEFQKLATRPSVNDPVAVSKISRIQGHLVLYPTRFLNQENLQVSLLALEYYIPVDIYM